MTTLRFEQPAADWLEALPLGDGRLGAMCFGDPRRPLFQLNHGTGWSGAPVAPGAARWASDLDRPAVLRELRAALEHDDHAEADRLARQFQDGNTASFLPLAELALEGCTATGGAGYVRTLDLARAVHTVRSGDVTHETFISASAGVLMHRVTGPVAARQGIRLVLTTSLRSTPGTSADTRGGSNAALVVRLPTRADDGVLEWEDEAGSVTAVLAGRVMHSNDETVVTLGVVTDFAGPLAVPHGRVAQLARAASARVDAALAHGWQTLLNEHVHTHSELWGRTTLALPIDRPSRTTPAAIDRADPVELTQLQFDLGRYLLIASTRPGGLPPTLQGLWNAEIAPPWRSNYTININTQMNHWAAAVTGLGDCIAPLLDHLEALAVTGAAAARRLYGASGWVAHHNTDAWAYAGQAGEGGDNPAWSFWPFGGVWLTLTACDALDFGLLDDADRLRLARIVRGCARFVLDWLVDDGHGGLTTRPSSSPENEFVLPVQAPGTGDSDGTGGAGGARGALASGSTMDLTLARALLERVVALDGPSTEGDEALGRRARHALDSLASPLPLTSGGEIREWGGEELAADPHHRHVSPLVAVYPGTAPLTDAEAGAAARTLEHRGDDSTGWSLVWKACLWARLGRADKVDALLALSRRSALDADAGGAAWRGGLYRNLFAAHPPFQIDGNLGFPAVIAEALVQSHRGRIDLLPALPPSLPTGRVRGLLARPGVLVDLSWIEGELVEAVLRAGPAGPLAVDVRYRGAHVSVTVTGDAARLIGPQLLPPR